MSTDARDYDETEAHPDRAMSPSAMSSTRMEYDRGDKMVETFFEHNKSRSRSLYDLMTLFMMQYGPTASVSGVLREVQAQRLLGFTEHSGGEYSSPVPQITTPVAPARESEEESDAEQASEPAPAQPAKKKKPTPKAAKTAAPKKTAPAPQPAPEPVEEKEEAPQSAPAPSAAAQALAADFFGDDEGDEVVNESPVEEEPNTAEDAGADTSTGTSTDTAPTDTDEDEEEEEDFFAGMRR